MVKYAPGSGPHASNTCTEIPYNFHPMYSTSSPVTRVPWAAHSYNVAFSDEIGHWTACNPAPQVELEGSCNQLGLPVWTESSAAGANASDADDVTCTVPSWPGALLISGCIGINGGFDGSSYGNDWPTTEAPSTSVPTPITFTSPLTGGADAAHDTVEYPGVAFETDLPRVEGNDIPGTKNDCQRLLVKSNGSVNRVAGRSCFTLPLTDLSSPQVPVHAQTYPWYNTYTTGGHCVWQIGTIPSGPGISDFGRYNQYAPLAPTTYLAGNGTTASKHETIVNLENFHHNLIGQPCPALGVVKAKSPAPKVLSQHITGSKASLPATGVSDDGLAIEAIALLALAAFIAARLRRA
jgi:hypothetical protein